MDEDGRILPLTVEIVAAYVSHNPVPAGDLPALLHQISNAIAGLGRAEATTATLAAGGEAARRKPAVPISRSVTPDFIISLEDGTKLRSLKRHLMARYGLTPQEYRAKWNLPPDYPMIAPNYAAERSKIAKRARKRQLSSASEAKKR